MCARAVIFCEDSAGRGSLWAIASLPLTRFGFVVSENAEFVHRKARRQPLGNHRRTADAEGHLARQLFQPRHQRSAEAVSSAE